MTGQVRRGNDDSAEHQRVTVTDEFGTEFPHGIGRVAKRALAANGYTRYEQLTTANVADLLKIHGVGPKAIRILREELASRGRSFADEA
jgi:predicted flap endonuclease-1-like 5' DNA nuclease